MSMRKVKIVLFSIIAVSGISICVSYADSSVPLPQQKEAVVEKADVSQRKLYQDLGLTSEQRKLLEENKNKHREQARVIFAQIRQKMDSLRQELEKSELNMQVIYQTNNELKQLETRMLDDRLEHILKVRKILTPEQFKKFGDKMKEHREHFKNKRERNKEEFR